MEETRVVAIDSETYKITKSCYSVIVANCDGIVIVLSLSKNIDGIPMVLWNNRYRNQKEARQKLYHLIGKLCTKRVDSKYFKNVREDEHMKNGGSCFGRDYAEVKRVAIALSERIS